MPVMTETKPKTRAAKKPSAIDGNPLVDEYIAKAAEFAQPVLTYLRGLVHQAVPDVVEEIKWSRPFFLVNGTIVCQMAAFKAHLGFGFWSPDMTAMLQADGVDGSDGSGAVGKIRSIDGLPPKADLLRYLKHAAERARAGDAASPIAARSRNSAKAPIPMPPEFEAALAESKTAHAMFEALPPSCRREYLEWISTAKRPETRDRRIAEAVSMIAAGRRFNDQYQSK
jgi:uncharacterized protein YdeI (YjbR/CyaY-like superfamily)